MTLSSRMINTLEWGGTAAIIAGTIVRATNFSNVLDLELTALGCFVWSITAYSIGNKPLLAVNAVSVLITGAGIIRHFFS